MLKVDNVFLSYPKREVLQNLSFQGKKGEVLGVLGKNGIGKTTLLNAVVGLKEVNGGNITLNSGNIGYVPENSNVYEYLTGSELLEVIGDIKGLTHENIKALLEELATYIALPNMDMLMSSYSKGNKEKILFILSLISNPDILIMDEPFTGFDPESIMGARRFLKEYCGKEKFIMFSTHIIEMAAQICNRAVILLDKDKSVIVELAGGATFVEKINLLEKYFA